MKIFTFDLQRFDEVHREGNMIYGTAGDDNISNEDSNVEIHSGKGYDNINNSGSNVYISAGDGGANIFNTGNNVRAIAGSLPSAFISNSGSNCVLWGGSITNTGEKTHLIGSPNDENFSNRGISSTISASDGDDYIANTGIGAVIYGEGGKDTIVNFAEQVVIDSGGDGDVVTNEGHHVKIYGGSTTIGNTITNYATDVYINGGVGSNEFHSSNHRVTIIAGDGDDTVDVTGGDDLEINVGGGKNNIRVHAGARLKITGGDDANTIDVSGYKTSIYSGKDDDEISYEGSAAEIYSGEGRDIIQIYDCDRNSVHSGGDEDLVLNGHKTKGIKGSDLASIYTAEGDDTVINYKAKNVTINTGEDKDYVENIDSNNDENVYSNIYTHTGDDKIINRNSRFAILKGGEGNDYFENDSSNVIILGGDDKDTVYNKRSSIGKANYDIIDGGAGDDSIVNENSFVTISSGAGKDTVENDALNVTITASDVNEDIDPDATTPTAQVNNAVVVEATSGKDKIYVKDNKVTIERGEDVLTINDTSGKFFINAGASNDHIGNQISSVTLNPGTGNDSVYNAGDNVSINATQSFKEDKNLIYNEGSTVTITAGAGSESIINNQGSNVTIDAGDSVNGVSLFGGENVSVTTGNGENSIIAYGNYTEGLGETPLVAYGNYSGKYLTIDAGGGKNLISVGSGWHYVTINGGDTSEGVDAIFSEVDAALIKGNKGNDYIKNTGDYAIIFGGDDGDIIENYGTHSFLKGEDGNDYIHTDEGNDVTIDGGNNNDIINVLHDVRSSIAGGEGNDYISLQRISASDIDKLAGGYLNAASYVFSHWLKGTPLQKNLAISTNKVDWLVTVGIWTLKTTPLGIALSTYSTAKTLYNAWQDFKNFTSYIGNLGSTSTVNGGNGDDTIVSDGIAPRIFEYKNGDGNDEIHKFTVENIFKSALNLLSNNNFMSTLHITQGQISEVQVNGSDVLFKIGTGSIKLVDGANKKFKLLTENGSLTTRAYGKDEETGELICSIFGSADDDVIKDTINASNTRYVIYGDSGADSLVGNDKNDTLWGGTEDDTMRSAGEDTLRGEGGNDFLYAANKSLLDGGADDDTIYSGKTISYPDPQGYVPANGNKNTVYGGTGDDEIHNYGNETSIEGGANNDYIYNIGENRLIEGSLILGGYAVTIDGGTGNDYIFNSGNKVLFKYNEGDDNDVIEGFNETSTLRIGDGDGTYSKKTSEDGFDIIVTVGNGTITLKDAAILIDSVNIEGTCTDEELPEGINIDGSKLFLSKEFQEDFLDVNGFSQPINIIDAAELLHGVKLIGNPSINLFKGSNFGDIYYCEMSSVKTPVRRLLATKSTSEEISITTIDASGGNDTIYAGDKPNLYLYKKGDGNDIIEGFKSTDTLQISDSTYSKDTIGNDILITVDAGLITLKDAADVIINVNGEEQLSWKLKGTIATYGNLVTISGVKSTEGLAIDTTNKKVTVSYSALNQNIVTISESYSLALSGVNSPTSTPAHFDGLTYKSASSSEGYSLSSDKKSIDYTPAVAESDLFSLSNVKNTESINVDTTKKTVILSADNLTGKNVSLTGDYSLALSGVGSSTYNAAHFVGNTYKSASKTAGYSLANDKKSIVYTAAVAESDLFSLSGVKSTNGISVDSTNKTVTIKSNNLDAKSVSFSSNSGGYSFKLDGVNPSTPTDAHFSGNTFKSASKTAGYELSSDKKSIVYTPPVAESDLFTLSNVKNTEAISVDTAKKTVTLNANNLTGKNVSITGDYSLALSGVDATKTTAAHFDGSTYKSESNTAGYALNSAKTTIKYTTAKTAIDLFTLSGIKSTSGIAVDTSKKTVTLKAANLNAKNVTFSANSGGYTMALASDVDTTKENISKWTTLSSGNVAYLKDGSGSYYALDSKKTAVTYNASVESANQIEFSGVKGTPTLSGSSVKLTASNFNSNVSVKSNAGGYTLALSGDFKNKTLTGTANADKITSSGSNLVISGGKGNDTATLGSNNTFLYAKGDGNDILYSFGNDDKIKLTGTTKATPSISGKDVIITTDGGKITVKDAAQGNVIKIVNDKDSVLSAYTYYADRIVNGKSVTLTSSFKGTFDAKNFTNVDGSAVTNAIKITGGTSASTLTGGSGADTITGGKANDKLFGNAGNDSLSGGDGNDTLLGDAGNDNLTGGKGKDTFVFSGGKDTITDYTAGDDNVSVAGSLGKGKFSVSGKNVVMTYGSNTLTITNGLDKKITFNGTTSTYKTAGIFNSDSTAVTLPTSTKTFDASAKTYSKVVTVDGSAVGSTIKITGNDKANVFTAGANDSTLSGGKGKDTLNGGAGKDSLVGGADNDKLLGNAGNDTLSGGDGNDTLTGGNGNDTLYGGAGNDSIVGDAGKDKLYGNDGNDSLYGGSGNDSLAGGNGDDYLSSGSGNDKLYGNAGADSLWGGTGNDTLYGGDGVDTFIYRPNEGKDTIMDYESGELLQITNSTFTNAVFSSNQLTLTIDGGGSVVFKNVTSSTEFNINGDSYQVSGSNLEKK